MTSRRSGEKSRGPPGEKEPLLQRSTDTFSQQSYTDERGHDDVVVSTETNSVRMRRHITLPYAVGKCACM